MATLDFQFSFHPADLDEPEASPVGILRDIAARFTFNHLLEARKSWLAAG
jgi:hypothetical protein